MDPKTIATIRAIRSTRPASAAHLRDWIGAFTGVSVASAKVCRDHAPPLDWLAHQWLHRPDVILILGARGSGKSFLQAILTHLESRFTPRMGTRILGGSKAQSLQVYEAISSAILDGRGPLGSDRSAIADVLTDKARYRNGSSVSILAASTRSVRGPHVPTLRLDEVDEIEPALREAAMGMVMSIRGMSASVSMSSTWHKVGGPMGELIRRGRDGCFPVYTTCTLDVLQRCPEGRSGPYVGGQALYERCPDCPIVRWCHAERDRNGDVPLAKLADGHYAIDSLIQKVRTVGERTFEADYLCSGPRADGLWFPSFSTKTHVGERAEYDPALPVHLAIDSGVFTGAVWFQVARAATPYGPVDEVHVFADYLAEGRTAEQDARAILEVSRQRCNGRVAVTCTDPAGGQRNPIGPTVIAEYERTGLRPLRRWPAGPVADGLALVESFLAPADGTPRLILHPRCTATAAALANYRRAKRAGQWQDHPEDPQHPHEDLVDALRGGLRDKYPDGRTPPLNVTGRSVGGVFY
jgi:hypothetical protein